MPYVSVAHPNGRTFRVVRVPELATETPMNEDEELLIALGARVAELEALCTRYGLALEKIADGDFHEDGDIARAALYQKP